MSTALVVEILATAANLAFIVLLIRENILCWLFGIIGSLLSVYLFLETRLYSESILYLFYAGMGVWGWLRWRQRESQSANPVIRWRYWSHVRAVLICTLAALGLGFGMQSLSDAQRPFFDAFTTSFSFFATYLEVTKVLEAWLYWLVINFASIWLYHDRSLDIYAAQIGVYSLLSIWGFYSWRQAYQAARN